jgi:ferritin-like metal-binding protein YciE
MKEMKNLGDLLKHELEDLYSAEEQIIDALPAMIENAANPKLKKALNDHLKVTKLQKDRLEQIKEQLNEEPGREDRGFFAKLFSGEEPHHCEAMEGIIREGEKILEEDMEDEVRDAAIIASCQKIEHYEISGYGTAKAYAMQLGLNEVADLVDDTLNEEYDADDSLTDLALSEVNLEAEEGEEETVKGLRKTTPRKTGSTTTKKQRTASRSKGNNPPKRKASTKSSKPRSRVTKSRSRQRSSR